MPAITSRAPDTVETVVANGSREPDLPPQDLPTHTEAELKIIRAGLAAGRALISGRDFEDYVALEPAQARVNDTNKRYRQAMGYWLPFHHFDETPLKHKAVRTRLVTVMEYLPAIQAASKPSSRRSRSIRSRLSATLSA